MVSPPTTAEKKPVVSSIPSTSSASKGPFPTSSFAGGKLQGPRKTSSSSTTTSAKKQKNPPIGRIFLDVKTYFSVHSQKTLFF